MTTYINTPTGPTMIHRSVGAIIVGALLSGSLLFAAPQALSRIVIRTA